jgi:hypothetical protein
MSAEAVRASGSRRRSVAVTELPFADQLSQDGRDMLRRHVVVHRFPAGKEIIAKGQAVSGAYFVLSGACQEFRVRAAILDLKEVPDGTTQSFPHSRRAPRPASGWSRSQNGF